MVLYIRHLKKIWFLKNLDVMSKSGEFDVRGEKGMLKSSYSISKIPKTI